MKIKTLLCDAEWNIKRNFMARPNMFSKGEHCGGSYGFLETLKKAIDQFMPDRVVVVWDGILSGKLRHDIYPSYKSNRNKSWDEDSYYMNDEQLNEESKRKYAILHQKIKVKNYLEELFVRQIECKYIEADDIIGQYVLNKFDDEEIIIYAADKDYLQLIDEKVSVFIPKNNELITAKNFKEKLGYTIDNQLILRAFEGDDSDMISGVDGIAFKKLSQYFPLFLEQEYSVDRFINESVEYYQNSKKKLKIFEKIIGSRKIIERNLKLMDLKRPFLTEEAKEEILDIKETILVDDSEFINRSVTNAIKMSLKDGYNQLMYKNDSNLFFQSFYRLVSKEKEYSKKILNN